MDRGTGLSMHERGIAGELALWRQAIVGMVRSDAPDLTTRQTAVLLTVYCTPAPHTVRGLASELGVGKPVVTRALDRLAAHGLLRRRRDARDRRNVLIERTVKGAVFLSELHGRLAAAMASSAECAA